MLIPTTRGEIDDSRLVKRSGGPASGEWVEYYLDGELVHRSVTVALSSTIALGTAGTFERYGVRFTFADESGRPMCS